MMDGPARIEGRDGGVAGSAAWVLGFGFGWARTNECLAKGSGVRARTNQGRTITTKFAEVEGRSIRDTGYRTLDTGYRITINCPMADGQERCTSVPI
jgi:hypothetical protein